MKIDWNKDTQENARLAVSDGMMTHYVSTDQLPETFYMLDVALAFSHGYDHGNTVDIYAVCSIMDLEDDESYEFAFDGHDSFQWDTKLRVDQNSNPLLLY